MSEYETKQAKFIKQGNTNSWDDFDKYIGKDPTFINMSEKLGLRNPNYAFCIKGRLYKAYSFPNFGSQHINWKEMKLTKENK